MTNLVRRMIMHILLNSLVLRGITVNIPNDDLTFLPFTVVAPFIRWLRTRDQLIRLHRVQHQAFDSPFMPF